jgi:hypothetical protein
LIYQHANAEADQAMAAAIDKPVRAARRRPSNGRPNRVAEGDGTPVKQLWFRHIGGIVVDQRVA